MDGHLIYFLPILRGIIMANSSETPQDPSGRKFRYSIDRRRTHETTVTLQATELALDSFRHKVDNLVSSRQSCLSDALTKLLQSNRVVPGLGGALKEGV